MFVRTTGKYLPLTLKCSSLSKMKLSTRSSLVGIAALAVLSLVHIARRFDYDPGIFLYLLGVLPNGTAAIAIPFIAFSAWSDQRPNLMHSEARRIFVSISLASTSALVAWEFNQQTSRALYFDPHDIGATFVGLTVAVLVFHFLIRPRQQQP